MCIRTPAAEAGAGDFRAFHRQDERKFLFLPPDHDIIFLHGGFIKSVVPDFEALALIKIYCLRVLKICVQPEIADSVRIGWL